MLGNQSVQVVIAESKQEEIWNQQVKEKRKFLPKDVANAQACTDESQKTMLDVFREYFDGVQSQLLNFHRVCNANTNANANPMIDEHLEEDEEPLDEINEQKHEHTLLSVAKAKQANVGEASAHIHNLWYLLTNSLFPHLGGTFLELLGFVGS